VVGPQYQWYRDGVAVAGATEPSYVFVAPQAAGVIVLRCVASTGCGSVTVERRVDVRCNDLYNVYPDTSVQSVAAGGAFMISAGSIGTPPTGFSWFRGGVQVVDGPRISGASTSILRVTDARLEDAGAYELRATASCGETRAVLSRVTVECPTQTTISGASTVAAGSVLRLRASLPRPGSGMGWTRDGRVVSNGGRVSGADSAVLEISGATLDDSGRYVFTGVDPCGTARTASWSVRVEPDCNPVAAPGNSGSSRCLSLDGAGDYASVQPGYLFQPRESLTVEAWVKPRANVAGSRLFEAYNACQGGNVNFYLSSRDGGPGIEVYSNDVQGPLMGTPTALTTSAWTHVAYVYGQHGAFTPNFPKMYVNGQLVASGSTITPQPGGRAYMNIGRAECPDNVFANVLIDEMRIWALERTSEQILANMRRTVDPATPGLRAYWRFDVETNDF
ncbi:MAG: hypothetical protein K2Q20_09300, partial [Phycisphaerales bacterium]|nr:hypothetical protein [Phycisphaerales bacterium]